MSEQSINVELSPSLPEQILGMENGRAVKLLGGLTVGRTNITIATEAIAVYDDLFDESSDSQSLRLFSEVNAPIGEGYIDVIAERFAAKFENAKDFGLSIEQENDFRVTLIQDEIVKFPQTLVVASNSGRSWHIQSLLEHFRYGADTDIDAVAQTLEQHRLVLSGLTSVLINTNMPEHTDVSRTVYLGMPEGENQDIEGVESGLETDGFENFAGIDGVIDELRDMVELAKLEPHILQNAGVERTQAVLFYGPSGVGKTELIKTLVAEIGANVIDTDFGEVAHSHVGEWASNIDNIFAEAFNSDEKVAIVFDEFDGLTQSGNQGVNGNINAVLKRRLEQLPLHPNVFVFMATNEIDSIDPVVRSHKRIPLQIPIAVPGQEDRKQIFKKLLLDNKLRAISDDDTASMIELMESVGTLDFERLAYITDLFTGGEISQIIKEVNKARLIASRKNNGEMPPITMESLEAAIDRTRKTKP